MPNKQFVSPMAPAEREALIEQLQAESQAIGAAIDAARDKRREIKRQIHRLIAEGKMDRFAQENPDVFETLQRDAEAPGAVVTVTGAEIVKQMASALNR